MSNFYGLEIARKSLFATQKAIEVTSHNIANVNTSGYSRQLVNFETVIENRGVIYDSKNPYSLGGGVVIQDVSRVRSEYYDRIYRSELALNSELAAKSEAYTHIEGMLAGAEGSSMPDLIADLFNSIDLLRADASDMVSRENVRQSAILLTDSLNTAAADLVSFQQEQNDSIEFITAEVNKTALEISKLNSMIFNHELLGSKANDLRDKRDSLVDLLSEKIGATAYEGTDGKYRVLVNGYSLVDHTEVNTIRLDADVISTETNEKYWSLYWNDTQTKVALQGGEIKARLDIRDGSTIERMGVNYLISSLNSLAGSLVSEFNTINRSGYTLPYGSAGSLTGIDFFDPAGTRAMNISLSAELAEGAHAIAASDTPADPGSFNEGNSRNLDAFETLRLSKNLTYMGRDIGNYESYLRKNTDELSFKTGLTASRSEGQRSVLSFAQDQKDSVSGVNLDEEMTNLVRFQRAYQASAKLITVIDEMLQTLLQI